MAVAHQTAHVEAGECVLVHSAAGGVGQAAIQLCHWKGAHVLGTASPEKNSRLLELGVEHCIDSTISDFQGVVLRLTDGRDVDVALNPWEVSPSLEVTVDWHRWIDSASLAYPAWCGAKTES